MSIHDLRQYLGFELCILYITGINIFMTNSVAFFPCMNAEYFVGNRSVVRPG